MFTVLFIAALLLVTIIIADYGKGVKLYRASIIYRLTAMVGFANIRVE